MVADRHDKITRDSGPSAGNLSMRTLRAIYNHARRSDRQLPADNPTMAVDWNPEKRRNTAMDAIDLPSWMDEAGRLRHVIRREFHLFSLLSGSRPGALKRAEVPHFNFARRILHMPRPKGGAKRAFDIPLSREMILCLVRAMRASRLLHPENAERWSFASDSANGIGHEFRRGVWVIRFSIRHCRIPGWAWRSDRDGERSSHPPTRLRLLPRANTFVDL